MNDNSKNLLKQISEVEPVYTTKKVSEFHDLYTTVVRIKVNGNFQHHRGPCRFTVLASEKASAEDCLKKLIR